MYTLFIVDFAAVSRRRRGNFGYECVKLSVFVAIIANSHVAVHERRSYDSVPSTVVRFDFQYLDVNMYLTSYSSL